MPIEAKYLLDEVNEIKEAKSCVGESMQARIKNLAKEDGTESATLIESSSHFGKNVAAIHMANLKHTLGRSGSMSS